MKKLRIHTIIFLICLIVAIALIISGFILPPTGVIDGSVLSACGELLGFSCIGQIPYLVREAKTFKTKIGDKVEVEVEMDEHSTND